MSFSDAWLDELRSRVSIVDVVSESVALKQKGRSYWGLCPFHGEKTASFKVDEDSQLFYCFGCHKGGNVISFVMDVERLEFVDAVKLLADRAKMKLPDAQSSPDDAKKRALREQIYEANRAAARFFHDALYRPEGSKALSYLYKRGLDDAGIRRFGLGATGEGGTRLTDALMRDGFPFETLKAAGLSGEKDGRRYDMFRERAIFPIIGAQGYVLGFGGRALGDATPKYLNTPDTPVFNKRQNMYALNMAKKERSLSALTLVEGYMDVVSLRQHGVPGVVATLGTALTPEQARLVKRYAPEVRVCYDGDSAGQKAILRALDIFEEADVPARVIDIPGGMDPDDFVRKEGADAFFALRAMPPPEYRMLRAADDEDLSTQDGRTKYAMRCCEILRGVKNPVELENYLTTLTVKTGFAREVLIEQIGVRAQTEKRETVRAARPRRRETGGNDAERAEAALVRLLADGRIPANLAPPDAFVTPLYVEMAGLLAGGLKPAALIDRLEGEQRDAAVRALQMELPTEGSDAAWLANECRMTIYIHRLDEEMSRIQRELAAQTDPEAKRALFTRSVALSAELDKAKNGRKEDAF